MPWVAVPAPPTTSSTTTTTTLAPAPRCSKSTLTVHVEGSRSALGNVVVPVVLANAGATPCLLAGYPALVAVYSASKRRQIRAGHGTYFGNLVSADLRPGAHGELLITGNDACLNNPPPETGHPIGPQAVRFRSIVVELPGGGGSFAVKRLPPCLPIDESQLGVPPPPPSVFVAVPGTLPYLQAEIPQDIRVRAGRVLAYVVTLTNPGAKPVSLAPCPGYTESLGLYVGRSWQVEERSYKLNCSPMRQVLPRQSARFAMRILVPAGARSGAAKLGWELDTGQGPFAGGVLTVSA
ncbi:MAG TPA: DUF4232 domain-containing protein [Acidimicrobiales bacterium]|nr:DUF4232 domain-containing protein [Acidimicrobiales bacterium]